MKEELALAEIVFGKFTLAMLSRMPPGYPMGTRHQGRPRTKWRDYILQNRIAWVSAEKLGDVGRERKVWMLDN